MKIRLRELKPTLYVLALVAVGPVLLDRPDVFAQQPKVTLGATADQKGYWEIRPGLGGAPRAADVPFQPWAKALYDYRQSRTDLYPPLVHCKPSGGPGFFNAPGFEIVEVPEQQRVFILNIAGPHSWRVIYTDGRAHPTDVRPTYLGHSIGKWDGTTLVIDTVGFNEKQWMVGSYPTTERLHLTERISRPDVKTLELRGDDRRPRRVHSAVVVEMDDLRDLEIPVDSRRRDLRVHLPGRQLGQARSVRLQPDQCSVRLQPDQSA